ncbi:MAG TPA: serine hydroxymethyltransferase [Candidatus Paceibacterota bacterium]|nr:serine hydroxymethyltransferase [Candidatus Paceibacterota bacterium]
MRDKAIEKLIAVETKRQKETLDLIPSENIVSKDVLAALGSPLVNKYSEGYPKKRYYAGNNVIDDVELLAQERARKVFRLGKEWGVNVQALSGSAANLAAYYALLEPGDTVMGLNLFFGGHLTHGANANFSSRFYRSVPYTLNRGGYLDYDEIRKLAKKEKPKMIIAGITAYPRVVDFKKFAAIAKEAKAYLLADIAHLAGLVAAGAHPSPFPHADVVTTTTHKTLRGPRGALIFSHNDRMKRLANGKEISLAAAIDKAVFPGIQGGPHDNQTAAIAVALGEAMTPAFKKYGHQIVKNAKALAHELAHLGFDLVSGGTDNHLLLLDLTNLGISGREAQDRLEKNGIIVNRNTVPYDQRSPFDPSGIRIGTPSLAARGMKESDMKKVAEFLRAVLVLNADVSASVKKLCRRFPLEY